MLQRSPSSTRSNSFVSSSDSDRDDDCALISAEDRRQAAQKYSIFDKKAMERQCNSHGINMNHAYKLWRYIVKKNIREVREVPNLPNAFYELLETKFSLPTLKTVKIQHSNDKSTIKLLLELTDNHRIESVIMRYGQVELDSMPSSEKEKRNRKDKADDQSVSNRPHRSAPRATVCVSSQVGCSMNCRFCATGTMGLRANLTCGEIIEQLYLANQIEPIRNIVFMGMGEPLDNYAEVISAVGLMTDVRVFSLTPHRITISSVGVVPRLRQMQLDVPDISLAISLHAPSQEIRSRIVPSARNWKINEIMEAAAEFVTKQKERCTRNKKYQSLLLEYVLIHGVNAGTEEAEALGEFLRPYQDITLLNLIPYNPSISDMNLTAPSQKEIDAFVEVVRSRGITTTVRQTFGQDIDGACGQLVVQQEKADLGSRAVDIEASELVDSRCGTKRRDVSVSLGVDVAVSSSEKHVGTSCRPADLTTCNKDSPSTGSDVGAAANCRKFWPQKLSAKRAIFAMGAFSCVGLVGFLVVQFSRRKRHL